MRLILKRIENNILGITSRLILDHNEVFPNEAIACTLEHAYAQEGSLGTVVSAKLLPGTYTCVRGMHRLHGMTSDFETFEVMGVVGHSGILFHVGNYNEDSDGCILLGHGITRDAEGRLMVTDSRLTFQRFMSTMADINQFQLLVVA